MIVALQFEDIIGLLGNPTFLWSLLAATWGAITYRIIRHRRHGPKTGPSQASGAVSFSLTKPRLSEEEIFRILTTTEVNIQIVRICETPKSAKEVAKALGDVYPGHKEKGFPAEKLGERLTRCIPHRLNQFHHPLDPQVSTSQGMMRAYESSRRCWRDSQASKIGS